MVTVTIAIPVGDVITSTFENGTRAIAYAASVEDTHTVINVITDAIRVFVSCAITTAHARCVILVTVTVAVTFWDVLTSTFIDFTRTVADAAGVEGTHTVIHVITDAICVYVSCAITTAHTQRVELVAVTVAVAGWDSVTATNATFVEFLTRAIVRVGSRIVVARCLICATQNGNRSSHTFAIVIQRVIFSGGIAIVTCITRILTVI